MNRPDRPTLPAARTSDPTLIGRALAIVMESRDLTIPEMVTALRTIPMILADILAGNAAMPAEMHRRFRRVFGVDLTILAVPAAAERARERMTRQRMMATAAGVN